MKVADVARYLGVQTHTVYRLIDDGKLPAVGRSKTALRANGTLAERREHTLVRAANLRAFMEASRVKPGELRRANLRLRDDFLKSLLRRLPEPSPATRIGKAGSNGDVTVRKVTIAPLLAQCFVEPATSRHRADWP